MPSIGGVWYTPPGKIRVVIQGKTYTAKRQEEKRTEKSPDWKGDDIVCWEKQTKKGDKMLSMLIEGSNYTALINQWKDTPEKPDMNVLEPIGYKDAKGF